MLGTELWLKLSPCTQNDTDDNHGENLSADHSREKLSLSTAGNDACVWNEDAAEWELMT